MENVPAQTNRVRGTVAEPGSVLSVSSVLKVFEVLPLLNSRNNFQHSAAKPQPNSTSAAKADFRTDRYGRAEARPSKTSQNSSRDAKNLRISGTEGAEKGGGQIL